MWTVGATASVVEKKCTCFLGKGKCFSVGWKITYMTIQFARKNFDVLLVSEVMVVVMTAYM
jgi:hypothetical protein